MASVVYPAATGDFGDVATVVVNGNLVRVPDTSLAAIVGSGKSVKFTASFDMVVPSAGGGTTHLHFNNGQTYVVSAAMKAQLIAASAPTTSI
jgi:hypothetical protein